MKILSITLTLAILINFTSCKKGDKDPTFSFGTRDALITNTWKLSKMSKTETTVNSLGSTDTKTFSFDGTTMTKVHNDIWGNEVTDSYSYSDKLIISKDNTYKRTIEENDTKIETKAFWYWHNSKKNKIGISFNNGTIYYIKRLARKDLILEFSEYTIQTDSDGKTITIENNEMLTYSAE